jgi:ribosomal-protein-alanine N-acetyltransferase
MTLSIVPLRWWHIARVSEIEQELFPDDAWSVEQFWQELAQDTRRYIAALDDDDVVGYAGTFILPPDSDLQTIAVRNDQQGRGVARKLLARLVDAASAQGSTHMILEVRADNLRGIDVYKRAGFERISTRAGYYPDGVDALIMRRRLGRGT